GIGFQVLLNRGGGNFSSTGVPFAFVKADQSSIPTNFDLDVLRVADFDNDQNLDIAIGVPDANVSPTNLRIVYDVAHAATFNPVSIAGLRNGQISIGDFNGDGLLDLVTVDDGIAPDNIAFNRYSGEVFLGTGTQTSAAFTFFGEHGGSGFLPVVRDINFDGRLDLIEGYAPLASVSGQEIITTMLVQLGDGLGGFATPIELTRPGGSTITGGDNLLPADLNGDGLWDFVNVNGKNLGLTLGDATTLLDTSRIIDTQEYAGVAVADFDADGRTDIVLSNALDFFRGSGDGNLQAPPLLRIENASNTMLTADVNGDGAADIVTSTSQNTGFYVRLNQGDGNFDPAVFYPVGVPGAAVTGLVAGDFNGDGRVDLAAYDGPGIPISIDDVFDPQLGFTIPPGFGLGGVSIYSGNGDGSFLFSTSFRVDSLFPTFLAGDFDGDGLDDFVTGQEIYINNGLDGFGTASFTRVGYFQGTGQAVLDFNGDGIMDLAVRNGATAQTQIWVGRANGVADATVEGGGFFTLFKSITTVGSVGVGDFNNDGVQGISIVNNTSFRIVDGTLDFTKSPVILPSPFYQVVGDINSDSFDDLITIKSGGLLQSFDGKGFNSGSSLPAGNGNNGGIFADSSLPIVLAASIGDYDNDGRLDVSLLLADSTVVIGFGSGSGSFANAEFATTRSTDSTPILFDWDQSGDLDLTIMSQQGQVLFREGQGEGIFGPAQQISQTRVRDLAFITDSATGKVRLAGLVFGRDQVVTFEMAPNGSIIETLTQEFVVPPGPIGGGVKTLNQPTSLASADLNKDGYGDLVVINSGSNDLTVFLGGPGGLTVSTLSLPTLAAPHGLSLVDIDGDTDIDIVTTNELSGDVSIFLNDGSGIFVDASRVRTNDGLYSYESYLNPFRQTGFNFVPGALTRQQSIATVVGDFFGDANLDLATINFKDNTFSVMVGLGGGNFADPKVFEGGTLPVAIVAGDFNNDTLLDVALLNSDDNTISVYLNDGAGSFTIGTVSLAGNVPSGFITSDVDGDNNLDFVIGNDFGDILIILGNGDGTFRPFVRVDRAVPFAARDLNGDGVADVVLANQSADQVLSQIRTAGTTTFNVGTFNSTAGVQAPGFVTLADINNDGLEDFLVTNSGSNNILIYLATAPGQFNTTAQSFFTGTNPVSLAVGRLNNDALMDVAVVNQGSNDVSVLFGSGSGASWTLNVGPRLDVGLGPNAISTDDYDSDGVPDLSDTNAQEATLWMLPGLGNGFFNDSTPDILPMPAPVAQTVFNLAA
ncbi:MAG: FG-GAP-like repeat-containing protein, partial [Gemmataceae bacterium]